MNNLAFQLCICAVAGWINRGQQPVIEYLLEENRVLRDQLGGRRLRLTDAQWRKLAIRTKALGRKTLLAVACIVTPDRLLRWYRNLVARKAVLTRSTAWCQKVLIRSGVIRPRRQTRALADEAAL